MPAWDGERANKEDRFLTKLVVLLKHSYRKFTSGLAGLPDGFDPNIYLKLNPDIAAAKLDPADHYLRHGRHEGRAFTMPALNICGEQNLKGDRETILVVSHEASRTGAPILSLNIVQRLVGRYNVVALLLGGGSLTEAFQQAGAAVVMIPNLRGNSVLAEFVAGQLYERFNFKFALVNSIESRAVLPALSENFVPTISLLHEFAAYTRPRDAFRDALYWSGEAVFSASVTMENAFAEYPDLHGQSGHILPQGRCLLPTGEFDNEQHELESARIRNLMRPKGIAEDTMVVLGAGFVQLRKGVDLFIECAARVVRTPGGRKCRFVWVGKGYDPDNDVGYSVYLADQIRRSGLQEHVFFIDETTAIEAAYEEADILLLTSRLDPLPNVAIDAMTYGVPVLCFNKTTGIVDFLTDSGLQDHCVAEYLDTADMAEKILTLINSQGLREKVGAQCREASITYFDMEKYVARLEELAREVGERMQQEKADMQTILDSGLFRQDFSVPPHGQNKTIETQVRGYVRAWASGIDRRKPYPGFHPGVYLEQHGVASEGVDPFADYLRAGRPEGQWNYPVIVAGAPEANDLPGNHRVALHIHAYYPELLPEMIARLTRNRICPDLFVSTTSEQAREQVVGMLKGYEGTVVDVQLVPNRGRDIGPLLTAFGKKILADYDYVGHVHTKKTADLEDASVGQVWYRFLLENLLGGESGAMADSILAGMKRDDSIGMIYPDDPYVVGWTANRPFAEPLAARMGLGKLPEQINFPVGTMFWARTAALAPMVNLNLDWADYAEEPLPYDGTMLHAIERLFPLTLAVSKLRSAAANVSGLTR
jgi:glycosyltransferase involved in cell wall biosynthesis